jgi:acetyl-CoA synthetase
MTIGDAKVLITSESVVSAQSGAVAQRAARLEAHPADRLLGEPATPGTTDLAADMAAASEAFEVVSTAPEDISLLHFTRGTTGRPRGRCTSTRPWWRTTSRAGWRSTSVRATFSGARPIRARVTGTSYGIISPLTNGATLIVDQAEFDAER